MSCEALTLTALSTTTPRLENDQVVIKIMATGTCLDCGGQDLLRYTLNLSAEAVRKFGAEKARQGFALKIKDAQFETLGPISFQRFLEEAMRATRMVDLDKLCAIKCDSPTS